MYHQYFGLQEPAFAIAVNPRYLYMSEQHREALAHLLFGLQGGGFVQLTGEVGTGKTTIIRCLLEQLPEDTDIALILNPMASVPELLSSICDELGARYIADQPTVKTLTDALYNRLLENHMAGKKTVLLIDEAQSLSREALEQIRLLTNLETNTEKLLNIILVGQPELNELLSQPSLRQLAQRITARYHLEPLTLDETRAYIDHRLQVAGLEEGRKLIPAALVDEVHRFSGGIPRLINIICERMLLGAYGQNRTTLNKHIFEQARLEIVGHQPENKPPAPALRRWLPGAHWYYTVAAGLLGVIVGALLFWPSESPKEAEPTRVASSAPTPGAENPETTNLEAAKPHQPKPGVPQPQLVAPASAGQDGDAQAESQASSASELTHLWPYEADSAQRELAEHLGLDIPPTGTPCGTDTDQSGHWCERTRLDTWNDLMALDRPVVMSLITPERKRVYAPLIGLNHQEALVLVEGQVEVRPWRSLAELWNGEVHYYRYRPAGFEGSLGPSDRGPAVTWLAEQFAQLDGERTPLTRERYTLPLQTRIEIFQRRHDLEADGLFGLNTLQRLNRATGLDPGLLDPDNHPAKTPAGETD